MKPSEFKFKSEGNSKYCVSNWHGTPLDLYGDGMWLELYEDDSGLKISGLSEKGAEALRAWPDDKPLEITFKIKEARIFDVGAAAKIVVISADAAIKGLE